MYGNQVYSYPRLTNVNNKLTNYTKVIEIHDNNIEELDITNVKHPEHEEYIRKRLEQLEKLDSFRPIE